jgi:carnitine 3-dehydrogenase
MGFAAMESDLSKVRSRNSEGGLITITTPVRTDWIDYNNHLTESAYLKLFGDATDVILARIGAGFDYVAAGHSYYTVETHICHLGQARLDEHVEVLSRVLAVDSKRFHLFHEMINRTSGSVIASGEHMLVHVDAGAGTSAPAPQNVLDRARELVARQAHLPPPVNQGRQIRMPASLP